ncbi:ATP-binding cassette domain-containing protein [Clostridiales bacterium COT073_COT-073]|nr:ATP-binding cassette domain-containing protein [Clostridiales bacterium COT073_COT-073]
MEQIELKHVYFQYPNGYLANEDLNLTVKKGEQIAIVGQNGAGKTTAVKLMNGLHKPSKGEVIVDGKNTKKFTTAQIARYVGYVFQNPDDQIFNQSVYAEIAYMPKYYKMSASEIKNRVEESAALLKIESFLDKNPFEIPYVMRKFVTIAAILATKPQYIILDEPTAGQDLKGIEVLADLLKILKKQNIGTVTITHDMDFVANNFERTVVMANKRIIADGKTRDIFGEDDILRESKIKRTLAGEVAVELGMGKCILNIPDFLQEWSKLEVKDGK